MTKKQLREYIIKKVQGKSMITFMIPNTTFYITYRGGTIRDIFTVSFNKENVFSIDELCDLIYDRVINSYIKKYVNED